MRFARESKLAAIENEFKISALSSDIEATYNAAPTQHIIAVTRQDNKNILCKFRWGLVPSWAKDRTIANKLLNARGETIEEKPSFREAYRKRRCIIPVDGYYEWFTDGQEKYPVYIQMKSESIFGLAGIWESWSPEDDLFSEEEIKTCTIITTESNEMIRNFHHRMPVIIPSNEYDTWLDPDITETKLLRHFISSFPSTLMKYHRVSKSVNSPRNNSPELIKPLDQ